MIVLFTMNFEGDNKPEILGLFSSQEEFDNKAPVLFKQFFDDNYAWILNANYKGRYYQIEDKELYVNTVINTLNTVGTCENPNNMYDQYFYKETHDIK